LASSGFTAPRSASPSVSSSTGAVGACAASQSRGFGAPAFATGFFAAASAAASATPSDNQRRRGFSQQVGRATAMPAGTFFTGARFPSSTELDIQFFAGARR
jgi:hypothetical protein